MIFTFHFQRLAFSIRLANKLGLLAVLTWALGGLDVRAQTTATNDFSNLNLPIPDGDPAGVSDVETVNSTITNLTSVRVRLKVAGQFNGDLYGYVRHVQGGVTNFCVLLNRVGRAASNPAGYADPGLDVLLD